jgi:hypothetical protein
MAGIEVPADYKYVDCGLSGVDSLFVHLETVCVDKHCVRV